MLKSAAAAAKKAVTDLSLYPKPGAQLSGFTLLRSKHVPELQLTALHLQHDKTGADYLHIARDDSNNVFSIGFKTNPPDATGVPHILEHTTLCGSEQYPIRDPFFKMLPRTLSNFMNAFTASEHTFYPFATTNAQDFRNLMSVYLDATLHPLLKETDFTQEGWRIGPENPADKEGKLVFKGVVYNEMKGQMSDAGYLFYIRFQDHIFPAIQNSGGDPQKMTELKYEQLKRFHGDHYHPSNAKLMTYGDMPLEEHLHEVDARLSAFSKIQVDQENRQPLSLDDGPKEVTAHGPVDPFADPDKQLKTSISWIVGDVRDTVQSFSVSLLSSLLMGGYGSPLYKGLIESGLGTDFSPNAGYDVQGTTAVFSVGLTGMSQENLPKLKSEVQRILREVRKTGFDRGKIDGHLHQLELALKHKTANFGLGIVQRIKGKWFTGVDPFDSLAWNDVIEQFEANMAQKDGYLEGLMDKYLLNDKTLSFTMAPSPTYESEIAQEESARLTSKIAQASQTAGGEPQARQFFAAREQELLQEQAKSTTQDLSCLPTVHVKDIPRAKPAIDIQHRELDQGTTVQWRVAPTNGLTYFRAIYEIPGLEDELRILLPLFSDAIMRLGTPDATMEELEDQLKLKTGGVSLSYHSSASPHDHRSAREGIALQGTALDRNVPDMLALLQKLILETDFDGRDAALRIRQLLEASADGVVGDIANSGHSYARRAAEAGLAGHEEAWLAEQVGGLSQVKFVNGLMGRDAKDGFDNVREKLKRIQKFAVAGACRLAVTCGPESVAANEQAVSHFLQQSRTMAASQDPVFTPKKLLLSTSPSSSATGQTTALYPLPYQVHYTGLALPTVPYVHPDNAPLQILAQLLTHKHLHHEIREKGGAYGGGAYARALDGVFGFYSYRDPNPARTLEIAREAGRWAVDKAWQGRDIEEAKISVFQGLDAPRAVGDEGMERFVSGVDEEMMRVRRERLLDVGRDEVRSVAERYVGVAGKAGMSTAVLGRRGDWMGRGWEVRDMGVAEDVGGVD